MARRGTRKAPRASKLRAAAAALLLSQAAPALLGAAPALLGGARTSRRRARGASSGRRASRRRGRGRGGNSRVTNAAAALLLSQALAGGDGTERALKVGAFIEDGARRLGKVWRAATAEDRLDEIRRLGANVEAAREVRASLQPPAH